MSKTTLSRGECNGRNSSKNFPDSDSDQNFKLDRHQNLNVWVLGHSPRLGTKIRSITCLLNCLFTYALSPNANELWMILHDGFTA